MKKKKAAWPVEKKAQTKSLRVKRLMDKIGRKSKNGHPKGQNNYCHPCTVEVLEKTEEMAGKGAPDYLIACYHGISATTMYKWMKDVPAFRGAIIKGRAKFVDKALDIESNIADGECDVKKHPSETRRKVVEYGLNRIFKEHMILPFLTQEPSDETKTPAMKSWDMIKADMYDAVDEQRKKFSKMNNKDLQQ